MKFTARVVEGLAKENVTAERIEWDDDAPGFGIRMRPGGSKNWVYQYKLGTKNRRMTLGSIKVVGLVKAREMVGDLQAKVRLGEDPAAAKAEKKEQAAETFKVIAERFLKFKEGKISADYHADMTRRLNDDAKPLHELPIKGIKRRHVAELLSEVRASRGESTTDHLRSALSAFFTWTLKEGLMGDDASNPVAQTHKGETKTRDRVLTVDELREIWEATAEPGDYNEIVRLLMFTLLRRGEIGGLDRKETDFRSNLITLPPTRTKNECEHKVPMSSYVVERLSKRPRIVGRSLFFGEGAKGYSGWSKSKAELDERIMAARKAKFGRKAQPMKWVHHDLRRTGDTMMNDVLGVEPHVVEAILNHISGDKSGKDGVAGVYNKAEYLAKKKDALDRWAAFILAEVATVPTSDGRQAERQADVRTASPAADHLRPAE